MELRVESLRCGYGRKEVVDGFSASLGQGTVFCLLGPNGVGKTTLFKTVLGLLRPLAGSVTADGRDIFAMSPARRARYLGYVPQAQFTPFDFKVLDVVMMGRTAKLGAFGQPDPMDRKAAAESLERLGVIELAERPFTELSGGERQMVMIARAITQEPAFLLMDEPASSLDFGNQLMVLDVIKSLAGKGLGVFMTTHSPDHVFHCGHQAALMISGREFVTGPLDEVMTSENLTTTYKVPVEVISLGSGRLRICRPGAKAS